MRAHERYHESLLGKAHQDIPAPSKRKAAGQLHAFMISETVTVRDCGRDIVLPIVFYNTIREFVTSRAFFEATTESPNRMAFWVNGEAVNDDCLLVPGDVLEFQTTCEKALITPRELIKKLQRLVGLSYQRHGGNHDIWKTADGRTVPIPRHARDLAIGTLKKILKEAGLDLSIREFISQ